MWCGGIDNMKFFGFFYLLRLSLLEDQEDFQTSLFCSHTFGTFSGIGYENYFLEIF